MNPFQGTAGAAGPSKRARVENSSQECRYSEKCGTTESLTRKEPAKPGPSAHGSNKAERESNAAAKPKAQPEPTPRWNEAPGNDEPEQAEEVMPRERYVLTAKPWSGAMRDEREAMPHRIFKPEQLAKLAYLPAELHDMPPLCKYGLCFKSTCCFESDPNRRRCFEKAPPKSEQ